MQWFYSFHCIEKWNRWKKNSYYISIWNPKTKWYAWYGWCISQRFFSTVLKIDNYDSSAEIYQEYSFNSSDDNSGRIDLLITTTSAWYPIEIKINADDQERQVSRYNKVAKEESDISKVYYLTLNGCLPSEKVYII